MSKSWKPALAITICAAIAVATPFTASSQSQNASSHASDDDQSQSFLIVPDSSQEHAGDIGLRAHTNHVLFFRGEARGQTGPSGETPASLRSVYDLPSSGGSGVIAIVDAYEYPTAENDLNVFSSEFGLPPCTTSDGCFSKVYASGKKPATNCGWSQEAALDIEWAHAMAPGAKIVLVEAASSSFTDLFAAVDVATNQVTSSAGKVGEVSMSWGGSEFSSEASNDFHFSHAGVVYFGASGDTGGATIYPSASPNVVAAGGTSVNRNANGVFTSETGWSGSGGGPSKYEPQPTYQFEVSGTSTTNRSIPDISFDANPNTGVSVYDSTSCQGLSGWLVFGGTSVASPSLSGVINLAGQTSTTTTQGLLGIIYANGSNGTDFRDILTGTAGKYSAGPGYDFVTGIGSCLGLLGK